MAEQTPLERAAWAVEVAIFTPGKPYKVEITGDAAAFYRDIAKAVLGSMQDDG